MLTAEFTNTGALAGDNIKELNADERFLHTAGMTLSVLSRYVDGHLGVVFPLDTASRGELLAVILGLRIHWDQVY